MRIHHRVAALLFTVLTVLALGVATADLASAHGRRGHNCPNPAGNYPPGQCNAQLGRSSYAPGQQVSFTTSRVFRSGEQTDGEVHTTPYEVGTFTANNEGVVSGTFTLPESITPGRHTFTLTGQTDGDVVSAQFTVTGAAPAVNNRGGGLPFTGGTAIWPTTGAGGALVLAGIVVLMVARRRRAAVEPAAR